MDTRDYNSGGLQYVKFLMMGEDQKRELDALCLRMGEDMSKHRCAKLGCIDLTQSYRDTSDLLCSLAKL